MRAQLGDVELEYEVQGTGPTIIMTHGIGGRGENFRPVVPGLAQRFRVVTYDVRGHGRSSSPPGGYTIAQLARDIAGLLDHLGIEKAVIMGTSMGGTITQRFILDFPQRTAAAVIMSTSSEVNEQGRRRWEGQAEQIEREGMAAWIRRSRPPEHTDAYLQQHPELLAAEEERIRTSPEARVYAQVARAVANYNYTAELEGVRVPTLVLVGSEDRSTPPGGSVIISRRIPGAELHILPGLGHNLAGEAPQQVVDLVTDFLTRALAG